MGYPTGLPPAVGDVPMFHDGDCSPPWLQRCGSVQFVDVSVGCWVHGVAPFVPEHGLSSSFAGSFGDSGSWIGGRVGGRLWGRGVLVNILVL